MALSKAFVIGKATPVAHRAPELIRRSASTATTTPPPPSFAAAVVCTAAAAAGSRVSGRRHRHRVQLRAEKESQGSRAAHEVLEPEVPGELREAWEKALRAAPEVGSKVWEENVKPLADTAGDESVGPVRFERIGGEEGGEILLYIPSVDFTGLLAAPQFPSLASGGRDLWRCFLPQGDARTGFSELTTSVVGWLKGKLDEGRTVTLLGDAFGGLLALAVATQLGRRLHGLVLVNPSTGFGRSPFRAFTGRQVSDLGARLLANAVGDDAAPFSFLGALADVSAADAPGKVLVRTAAGALGFRSAAASALAGTLDFRLRAWLRDGWEVVESDLRRSPDRTRMPPTLVLHSGGAGPKREAERLAGLLEPRCESGRVEVKEVKGGREPLASLEADLAGAIRSAVALRRPRDIVNDFEFPTIQEVEEASVGVERLAAVCSPVFCSTVDGQRVFGLEGVPTPEDVGGRPVLLVGNHQLLGLDLGPVVREFIVKKGVIARGLAYPGAMRRRGGAGGQEQGPRQTFETFGAVPVTPRNIFKLMQKGEMILLFPGGVREALHGRDEELKLFWPTKTDFVRVAARFNAVVVPFGGVGVDGSVAVVGTSEELREQLGRFLPLPEERRRSSQGGGFMPVSESLENGMRFPFVVPRLGLARKEEQGLGDRHYYSFGKPVDLKSLDPNDRDACAAAYAGLREAVQQEINWLVESRTRDPYRDLLRRQLYERLASLEAKPEVIPAGPLKGAVIKSYGRRAPSFSLEQLVPAGMPEA